MVLQLYEDLVWTDYSGRKVEDVGQTGGFGCLTLQLEEHKKTDVTTLHKHCIGMYWMYSIDCDSFSLSQHENITGYHTKVHMYYTFNIL